MNRQNTTKLRTGEPVSFPFEGCILYGMLHNPPPGATRGTTGIILLNPGPTDRNGPHRLYYKLAGLFAREGYPTLRFDARGVGESEGEWEGKFEGGPVIEIFDEIQKGIWVPDTLAAIDFLIKRTGVRQVILGGLCGGAITALLAGSEHSKVVGFFMMGIPVTLSSATANVQDLPEAVLSKEANRYLKKLLRPSAWWRLLTLRTDLKTLGGVMISRVRSRTKPTSANPTRVIDRRMNPHFISRFKSAVENRKIMVFIYSENDYLWHEFKEYFLPTQGNGSGYPFEYVTIHHANHNLTETVWQDKLNKILVPWLESFTTSLSAKER
jgi:pimeloyl-ACP methyl ester carboxylesterase